MDDIGGSCLTTSVCDELGLASSSGSFLLKVNRENYQNQEEDVYEEIPFDIFG